MEKRRYDQFRELSKNKGATVPMSQDNSKLSVYHPSRWGLPQEAIDSLAGELVLFFSRFRRCFWTKTRRSCHHALTYIKGLMLLHNRRNFVNIERRVLGIDHDGQNLQQFMSDSTWRSQSIFSQIQAEIKNNPQLAKGCLLLDDSGDDCDGDDRAGAARQYIGRFGKVEQGVVGVSLSYYHHQSRVSCMVDGELFLPEKWFTDDYQSRRTKCNIPTERKFEKKTELALKMIDRARGRGLPFSAACCDSHYGRDRAFRRNLHGRHIPYMADTIGAEKVFLRKPKVFVPKKKKGRKGRKTTQKRAEGKARSVANIAQQTKLRWRDVFVRHTERGELVYRCARVRVWTFFKGELRLEWLFIWKMPEGKHRYSMSNGKRTETLERLAFLRAARYFVEHDYQKAKSEAGWDELQAQKYDAWCHHTALCALCLWFVVWLKLKWKALWPQDNRLLGEFGIEQLPELSMANIKELLRAVMPLKQLSPTEARALVIQHLINRSRSTACRNRKKPQNDLRSATNSDP